MIQQNIATQPFPGLSIVERAELTCLTRKLIAALEDGRIFDRRLDEIREIGRRMHAIGDANAMRAALQVVAQECGAYETDQLDLAWNGICGWVARFHFHPYGTRPN